MRSIPGCVEIPNKIQYYIVGKEKFIIIFLNRDNILYKKSNLKLGSNQKIYPVLKAAIAHL